MSRAARLVLALLTATPLAACGSGPDPAGGEARGEVVVLAAASLTEAFAELGEAYEDANPGSAVTFSFAGSQSLAAQIVQGAPADVFASANAAQLEVVAQAGLVAGDPAPFLTNRLAIAVEAGNPLGITGLADLADPAVVLVLAAPDVPAGGVAAEALDAAGVQVRPASLEVDVRSVLAKVELGEADAGIVYTSDLVAAGDAVDGVVIPPEQNVVATYPIALLAEAPNPAGGQDFIDLVRSEAGQAVLADHGFAPVP